MPENISAADDDRMTLNAGLADEIRAVNPIFQEDTLLITSTYDKSTAMSLKLFVLDYCLEFSFPQAYPDEPPQINGLDPLYLMIFFEPKQRLRLMSMHLNRIFLSGKECLFEFISTSSECLPKSDLASKIVIYPDLAARELQQKLLDSPHLIDITNLLKKANCAACMDIRWPWIWLRCLATTSIVWIVCRVSSQAGPGLKTQVLTRTQWLSKFRPQQSSSATAANSVYLPIFLKE